MKHLISKLLVSAMAFGLGEFVVAAGPVSEIKLAIESMSVAQLETAGDLARSQKDYDQAIKYFNAALRKDPKNAVLYNKLGLTELKTSDFVSARINFQKAVKRNSKFADAVNNLGAVAYMEKRYGAAEKQFKKAVKLDASRPVFHVNLGAAWFAENKMQPALTEYMHALELDPNALSASTTGIAAQIASPEDRAKYQYMLAKIFAQRGDIEECLRCLKMAKEEGYKDMTNVYKDEGFSRVRNDSRLSDIVPPPQK